MRCHSNNAAMYTLVAEFYFQSVEMSPCILNRVYILAAMYTLVAKFRERVLNRISTTCLHRMVFE